MKSYLRLTVLLIAVASFASCTKVGVIVDVQPTITGSWILTDAAEKDAYGWTAVNTGVENGVFTFYSNGQASYVENGSTLKGTWSMNAATGGYYDESGVYYTNSHQNMQIHVSNYKGDDVIDMAFDNVTIYPNSFIATNYNNHTIGRYKFSRY
jgi:hypothetical protein